MILLGLIGSMTSLNFIEVTDYWPEVGDDLSKVTWSHATNSHDLLYQALQDDTMMIEADVNIGLNGEPIMAHPPVIISDLSLQQFLDIVIEVNSFLFVLIVIDSLLLSRKLPKEQGKE